MPKGIFIFALYQTAGIQIALMPIYLRFENFSTMPPIPTHTHTHLYTYVYRKMLEYLNFSSASMPVAHF